MDVSQEDEITLQEALETQEMLESQSAAVLGASDPQNCSYSKVLINSFKFVSKQVVILT